MSIVKAGTGIQQIKWGEVEVLNVRLGENLIWTRPGVVFDRFAVFGELGGWLHEIIEALVELGRNIEQTIEGLISGALTALGLGNIPNVSQIAAWVGDVAAWPINLLATGLGLLENLIGFLDDVISGAVAYVFALTPGAPSDPVHFLLGSIGGVLRMILPDQITHLPTQVAQFRYGTDLLFDDGYLEILVADSGAPNHVTQMYRRYSSDGTGKNGVGIDLRNSQVSIVARVNYTSAIVAYCGNFIPGDILRLVQVGDMHTLYRNGEYIGEWEDTESTAPRDEDHRSVGVLMTAGKLLLGPTEYSPGISYFEAG